MNFGALTYAHSNTDAYAYSCVRRSGLLRAWEPPDMVMTGQPSYYARYANGILLWMRPDREYQVVINGTTRFAPLVNDTDTNPYLEDGKQYILALSKAYLLENVIRNFDEADRQWTLAGKRRNELLAETSSRLATGKIRPHL